MTYLSKLIEDTRQQKDKHDLKHEYWMENGVAVYRSKLPFGDYCTPPKVAVDTKANMSEMVQNIVNDHLRFQKEVKQAQEMGTKLIFLIEDEIIENVNMVKYWQNPRRFTSPKAPKGPQIYKAMVTLHKRYGCEFKFCKPEEAGYWVLRLLEEYGE